MLSFFKKKRRGLVYVRIIPLWVKEKDREERYEEVWILEEVVDMYKIRFVNYGREEWIEKRKVKIIH